MGVRPDGSGPSANLLGVRSHAINSNELLSGIKIRTIALSLVKGDHLTISASGISSPETARGLIPQAGELGT